MIVSPFGLILCQIAVLTPSTPCVWGVSISTDIHRMTSLLTQDCCRTMVVARASPRSEGQDDPTAGEIGARRLGCSGIAFIRAHLSHGSRWNRWRPNARHAAAGSGGGRAPG